MSAPDYVLGQLIRKRLTNDEIIASVNTPQILVPPTEILNYSGMPTILPVAIKITAILNATAGAFTNPGTAAKPRIVYGSDWSLTLAKSFKINDDGTLSLSPIPSDPVAIVYDFTIASENVQTSFLQDNAIAFVVDDDISDGHVDNYMDFWVQYQNQIL